jgi:threonine dehydratase
MEGVITASMGNTATGLAYAGRLLNYPVAVVMPETVSPTKLKATRKIGAEVILKGQVGDDAIAHSVEVSKKRNILFVHPHKTPPFLQGNATVAQEIIEALPDLEQIFIPIGGGGLASGVCQYIKGKGLSVKPIAVEAENAPAFHLSFKAGRPVRLEKMDTIADALTLMEPDPEVFSYLYKNLEKVVTVSEDEIVLAMKILFEEFRVIAEPGGAAPLAAMLKGDSEIRSAAIISGGNVSLEEFQDLMRRVAT